MRIQVQKVQTHKNTARESQATKNNFPQVFLKKQGFFPEVFKDKDEDKSEKVPERAQKEGQRVPGDTERARES